MTRMHNWNVKKHFFFFVLLEQRRRMTSTDWTKMAIDAVYILTEPGSDKGLKTHRNFLLAIIDTTSTHSSLHSSKSAVNWNENGSNNSSAIDNERACVNHSRSSKFSIFRIHFQHSTTNPMRKTKTKQLSDSKLHNFTIVSGLMSFFRLSIGKCSTVKRILIQTRLYGDHTTFYMCFDQFWLYIHLTTLVYLYTSEYWRLSEDGREDWTSYQLLFLNCKVLSHVIKRRRNSFNPVNHYRVLAKGSNK